MTTNTSIADIVVHLHPDLSASDEARIEERLRDHNGVVSVHFDAAEQPHALVVAYNPDALSSDEILSEIKVWDNQAVMAGL